MPGPNSTTALEKEKNNITDYVQYLDQMTKDRPDVHRAFEDFRRSLRILQKDIAYFTRKDEKGNYPVVKEEDRKSLLNQYRTAAGHCMQMEGYAVKETQRMPAVFYDIIRKITKVLAEDQKVLLIQKENLTLPEMKEKLKHAVDLTKVYGNAAHGQASERLAVQIVSGKGEEQKPRKGFYTKNQVLNQDKQFSEHYAVYNTESNLKKCFAELQEIGGPSFSMKDFFEDVRIIAKENVTTLELGKKYRKSDLHEEYAEWLSRVLSSEDTRIMVIKFAKKTQNIRGIEHTTRKHAGIEKNSALTQRNCAMTDVAHLMEMDSLLARSEPMTVLTKDGLQEGVFMQLAEGSDLRNLAPDDPLRKIDFRDYHRGNVKLMKSAADLQVLDFLCGNIDRHCENFTYITDKESGNLVSIQGFDNDMSFGTVPEEYLTGEIRYQNFTGIKDFKFITETTAEKLQKLTKEQLTEVLKKYPLSPKEIQAACKRLDMLKDALDPVYVNNRDRFDEDLYEKQDMFLVHPEGKVYVLPDRLLRRLNLRNHLAIREVHDDKSVDLVNIFARIDEGVRSIFWSAENNGNQKEQPQEMQPNRIFEEAEIMNKTSDMGFRKFQEKFQSQLELLKSRNKGAFIGSQEYDNVLAYAAVAAEEFRMIRNQQQDKQTNQKIRQIAENLSALAEVYLDKKMGDGSLKKQRANDRYHAVEGLLQLCTSFTDPAESPENQYRRMSYLQRTGAYRRTLNSKRVGEIIKQIRNAQKQGNHDITAAQQNFAVVFDGVGREGWKTMIADYRSELTLLLASMDSSRRNADLEKILPGVHSLNQLGGKMKDLEDASAGFEHSEEGMEQMKSSLKQIAHTAKKCLQEFRSSKQPISQESIPLLMDLHRVISLAEKAEDCHAAPSQEYENRLAGKLTEKLMIRRIQDPKNYADVYAKLCDHEEISARISRTLDNESFRKMIGNGKTAHLQQLYEQEDRILERWDRAHQEVETQHRKAADKAYSIRK